MQHARQVCRQPWVPKPLAEVGHDLNCREIVQYQLHTLAVLLEFGEDGP